jgi:hypothetical protein
MSDSQAADLSRRVGIIHRLYNTQLETFKSVSSSALTKTEELKKKPLVLIHTLVVFKITDHL